MNHSGKFLYSLGSRLQRVLPGPLRFALDGSVASLTGRADLIRHLDLTAGLVRRWLKPGELFVGWILHGDEDNGAARVHALKPHSYLRRHGMNSVILRKPRIQWAPLQLHIEDLARIIRARFDVVVFLGFVDPDGERIATALRGCGTRTVYVTGDPIANNMREIADWVVVPSENRRRLASAYTHKLSVIESVIDAPDGLVKDYSRAPRRKEIRVVWVGYPENLPLLKPVREALKDPRLSSFRLVTISRGPDVTFQWHRRKVWRQLLDCDIAVLPSAPTEWYQAKPNTRMTMFKALGIPIVASPIPSYLETLSHGRSCYFAQDISEWVECLLALADFDRRREIGLADRGEIISRYGVQAISHKWLSLFQELSGRRRREVRTEGSIHV
jgi:glycosyltransferase involved in cell wall biosynthesis